MIITLQNNYELHAKHVGLFKLFTMLHKSI